MISYFCSINKEEINEITFDDRDMLLFMYLKFLENKLGYAAFSLKQICDDLNYKTNNRSSYGNIELFRSSLARLLASSLVSFKQDCDLADAKPTDTLSVYINDQQSKSGYVMLNADQMVGVIDAAAAAGISCHKMFNIFIYLKSFASGIDGDLKIAYPSISKIASSLACSRNVVMSTIDALVSCNVIYRVEYSQDDNMIDRFGNKIGTVYCFEKYNKEDVDLLFRRG